MPDNDPQIIRSLVFVAAHDRDRILRAADAGMDALCLDLEDSTPLPQKDKARSIFRDVAKELTQRNIAVFVRTNGLDHPGLRDDLSAVLWPELHCVSLPKAETADDITRYCELLDEFEASNGVDVGRTLLRPVIETAPGVRCAYEIAMASPRIAYMGGVSGGEMGDLGASIGFEETPHGRETFYLRSKVLIDVRAAGVPFPIGGYTTSRRDVEGVREFSIENRELGYNGVMCPGAPEIVKAVNEVFTPSRERIDAWLKVLPALEQAEKEGLTATTFEGRHLDVVGIHRIREQLALARRVGALKD
jgi:citrate lyase subunit beta/citryl-CoA lyase